ncbi:MAG TPA: YiiX/YebB-like N1pC/P60 family cysteine hydrolase [Rhodocyclaceae bacterium]|nr:YiiX/YebB-like N1pC/P60 family cysteine hydrolase [Rhodocyclaceae bacterium]
MPRIHLPRLAIQLALLCSLCLARPLAAADTSAAAFDLADYQQRVAGVLEVRAKAYRFAQDNGILNSGLPKLTREQSNKLRDLARQYLRARSSLLPEAERVSGLFHNGVEVLLTSSFKTGTRVPQAPAGMSEDVQAPQRWLNPLDEAGKRQMLDIQRGLAAAMVLMDSFRIAVEPYEKNAGVRFALSYDVDGQVSLRDLSHNYHSLDLRTRLYSATRFVDDYMAWRRSEQLPADADEEYLYALTQSTLWYADLRESGGGNLADTLGSLGADLNMQRQYIQNVLSYGLSMGFGNIVGLVQTRRGKLAHMPEAEVKKLAGELKPLDILLEKTPFRLTDKMIPGHYGHVAVWLGSEEELQAIGVWNQISPVYQQQIRKGGRIVEALRGGVTISTLQHFLNIDDLLVLRDQRPVDEIYRRAAVLTALDQVGKEYDFNFDVYSHKRIVCSELAYVVFPDVEWPLARTLGRYTISPDNVAQMAVNAKPVFEPAVIFRDGKRVDSDLRDTLAKLIGSPPQQMAKLTP